MTIGKLQALSLTGLLLITGVAALLSGCMSPLIGREAEIHYEAAGRYDDAGDFVSARDQYWQAPQRPASRFRQRESGAVRSHRRGNPALPQVLPSSSLERTDLQE